RGRRHPPLLRAPLLREAPLRDRVLPGRRPGVDAAALRGAPDRGAEAAGPRRELPRRHRRLLLRDRLPALVGLRGATARLLAQRVRERLVRAPRGRRAAARAVVARAGPDGRRAAA